jgi:hypothetical protein
VGDVVRVVAPLSGEVGDERVVDGGFSSLCRLRGSVAAPERDDGDVRGDPVGLQVDRVDAAIALRM